jgi:hypothetical protein
MGSSVAWGGAVAGDIEGPSSEDPFQDLATALPLSEHALEHLLELGATVTGGAGCYLSMLLSIF